MKPKHHKLTFQVTLTVPVTVSSRKAARYIRDAVYGYGGGYPPDDPFFNVPCPTVKPVKKEALKEKPMTECHGELCEYDGDCCEAIHDGKFCTRERGHTGPHIACGTIRHNLHSWPQTL